MVFQPYQMAPGIVDAPTEATKTISWKDGNLIRWVNGRLAPIGAWEATTYAETASPIRRFYNWNDSTGETWTAVLCDNHLYVLFRGTLHDITPAGGMATPDSTGHAGGYGDYEYNYDTYGTERPQLVARKQMGSVFSLYNWGDHLLAMTSFDGRLLQWIPNPADIQPATVVDNAPVNNRAFAVTPERHVILFDYGGNTGQIAWCDQEDVTNWNFTDLVSKAGFLPVFPTAPHVGHIAFGGAQLTHTAKGSYLIRPVGLPYIYAVDPIEESNTPLSDRVIIESPMGPMWFSENGFWVFNGSNVQPIDCPLWNEIKEAIDKDLSRFLACAIRVVQFSEIWFFFPSKGSAKNDTAIVFNYRENWWSKAKLSRSAGTPSTYLTFTLMADDTKIYQHEQGTEYIGVSEYPWIEGHVISDTSRGGDLTFRQMKPDVEGDYSNLRFSLNYRMRLTADQQLTPNREMFGGTVDFMVTGKDFAVRIGAIDRRATKWTIGASEIDVVGRGVRRR